MLLLFECWWILFSFWNTQLYKENLRSRESSRDGKKKQAADASKNADHGVLGPTGLGGAVAMVITFLLFGVCLINITSRSHIESASLLMRM